MAQQNVISPKELEKTISDLMLELGIPAHLRGYQFLRSAVGMCVEDMELVGSVTKLLYPGTEGTAICLKNCSDTQIHWSTPDRRTVNISPL